MSDRPKSSRVYTPIEGWDHDVDGDGVVRDRRRAIGIGGDA